MTDKDEFGDLAVFHDPNLHLTIRGKKYTIPQPNAKEGLRIRQLFGAQFLSDATEVEEIMKLLGADWVPEIRSAEVRDPMTGAPVLDDDGKPVIAEEDHGMWAGGLWDEMVADGVTWDELLHVGRTALIDVGVGRIAAEVHWKSGLTPTLPDAEESEGNSLPAPPAPNREARRAAAKKAPAKKAAPRKKAPAKD